MRAEPALDAILNMTALIWAFYRDLRPRSRSARVAQSDATEPCFANTPLKHVANGSRRSDFGWCRRSMRRGCLGLGNLAGFRQRRRHVASLRFGGGAASRGTSSTSPTPITRA